MLHIRSALAILAALALVACGKDDEDRIDEFVEAVTGEVSEARVEHVLQTYLDLEAEPLDVRALGEGRVYRAEERERLVEQVRKKTQRLLGSSLKVLRKRIDLTGDEARVDLQLLGQNGIGEARYELKKHGERWLLSEVAVMR